jgi:hypothetical protein
MMELVAALGGSGAVSCPNGRRRSMDRRSASDVATESDPSVGYARCLKQAGSSVMTISSPNPRKCRSGYGVAMTHQGEMKLYLPV